MEEGVQESGKEGCGWCLRTLLVAERIQSEVIYLEMKN